MKLKEVDRIGQKPEKGKDWVCIITRPLYCNLPMYYKYLGKYARYM